MYTQKGSDHRCLLEPKGQQKLANALKPIFNKEKVTNTAISSLTGLDRELFAKIQKGKDPVTFSSLDKLFYKLHQELIKLYGNSYHQRLQIDVMTLKEGEDYRTLPNGQSFSRNPINSQNVNRLAKALLKLNYEAQCDPFRNLITNQITRVGAFLIQGEPKHGQRWLIHRLLEDNIPKDYVTLKQIKVHFNHSQEVNIDEVWHRLAKQLGVPEGKTENYVDKTFEYWKTQTVAIKILNIHTFHQDVIYKLIENFWKPLSKKISTYSATDPKVKNYLFMFLTDNQVQASKWKINWASCNDLDNWHSQIPISLPVIKKFSTNNESSTVTWSPVLSHWLEQYSTLLNHPDDDPIENLFQEIWNKSKNGTPEDVFEAICAKSSCRWSYIEKEFEL